MAENFEQPQIVTGETGAAKAPAIAPWRRHVSFPGALKSAVEQRMEELESGTFSRFAVELVCFDLRIRRKHSISGPIARETEVVQTAIDRYIVRHYRPGMERSGDAIRALVRMAKEEAEAGLRTGGNGNEYGLVVKEDGWVLFPGLLREIIEIRWRELECDGVSGYLTSLIRYDLLLGGPHKYFHGDDCDPEMLAALDRETFRCFHEHEKEDAKPEIFADRIMAEEAGMPLLREESEKLMLIAAEQLRKRAIERWEAGRGH